MLRIKWHIVFLTACLALAACTGGSEADEDEGRPTDALRLYRTTCRLAHIYADSIRNAPDSASATSAFEHLQTELDSLNFSVEADTDLLLTEGENDTVYMNLIAVRQIYDNRLRQLKKVHVPAVETEEGSGSHKNEDNP